MFNLNEKYTIGQLVEMIGTDAQKRAFEKNNKLIGNSKTALLKELATMVKFEEIKEGRKLYFLITEIFEEKQEKYDGRIEQLKDTNFALLRKQNNKLFIQGITNFYKLAEEKGYIVLGEYIKNDVKVKVQCKNGHITEVYPTNLKINKGCKICRKELKKA